MWDIGLAHMFKERDNIDKIGNCIGKVVDIEPIKISILNGDVILQEEQLYICSNLLDTYTRKYKEEGNIQFRDINCGTTNNVNDGGQGASSHNHIIENISIKTEYNSEGTIVLTDTLKVGDEVLIVPSESEQIFFIVDKVQKVGG